jgi:hypothetical protein
MPVIDTYYNGEYDLSRDYSEEIKFYGFRLPVIPYDKLDIEIKIKKEDTNNFDGLVNTYATTPTDEDIRNYGGTPIVSISQNNYYEGDYAVYCKTYQVPEGINYFAVYAYYNTYQLHSYIHVRINLSRYKYSYIKDLPFNTNYEFDTSIFSNGIIPNNYGIFMRLPINRDTIEIQLETRKAYTQNAFKVDVCEFDHLPTSSEVYFGTNAKKCFTNLQNKSTENLKYKYPFSAEENVNYISICVTNQNEDLSYIKTNIYKEVSPGSGSAEKNNFSKILLGLLFLILI